MKICVPLLGFLVLRIGPPLQVNVSAFCLCDSPVGDGGGGGGGGVGGGGGSDEPVTPVPCWPSYNLFKYCNTVRVTARQWLSLLPVCDSLQTHWYLWFISTKATPYTSYSFANLE